SFIEGNDYKEITAESLSERSETGMSFFRKDSISEFLNSSYANFIDKKNKFNLVYVINYYVNMKQEGLIEIMYLMGSVLLETIKYAYAAKYKEYKTNKNGRFIKN